MDGTPLTEYQAKIWRGELNKDPQQLAAMEELQRLFLEIDAHCEGEDKKSLVQKMFSSTKKKRGAIKSVYMHGGVGRGKSMLMDLFFDLAPTTKKRRVHFHEFMDGVHRRLHIFRQSMQNDSEGHDPIIPLAHGIVEENWLLCFDEFFVSDIADAMILSRLFTEMFKQGLVMVATSNIEPENLYKDGLQREHFLPFIDLLQKECAVVPLGHGKDFRLGRLEGDEVYITPNTKKNQEKLDNIFTTLTRSLPKKPKQIKLKGRSIAVPESAGKYARFSFDDLCTTALGAADYLKLAQHFHTIFLEDIPILTPEDRNEAKRFVNLIDTLYEKKVRLICTAAASPEKIYEKGDGTFEFDRTISRLKEMQSNDYLEAFDT